MTKFILILFVIFNTHAAESIGTYGNGSLVNPMELNYNDYGLQIMRPIRKANFGHDILVDFIRDLSSASFSNNLGQLLIGDLSDHDGGFLAGHSSHQIGLDVDIWFWRPSDDVLDLPREQRNAMKMPLMLDALTNDFLPGKWDERLENIIKMAAEDNRVARIFVNPGIKKKFCQMFPGHDFVKKIRPWFRHHEHFHVRLKCPKDSPKCVNQKPQVEFECSGEKLDWWFSEDFKAEYRRRYGDRTDKSHIFCDAH